MKKHQQIVLLIGLCLCVICVLFPPRRLCYQDDDKWTIDSATRQAHPHHTIPHGFILSEDFDMISLPSADGHISFGNYLRVEIDTGALLVDLCLIVSLAGIVCLIQGLVSQKETARHDA
jgi:hypothetical protein